MLNFYDVIGNKGIRFFAVLGFVFFLVFISELLNKQVSESTFEIGLPIKVTHNDNFTEVFTPEGSFVIDELVSVSFEGTLNLKYTRIESPLRIINSKKYYLCQEDKCVEIDGRLLPDERKTSLPNS